MTIIVSLFSSIHIIRAKEDRKFKGMWCTEEPAQYTDGNYWSCFELVP